MSEDAPRRIQILVAEDTATGRQVIRNHLDHEGFELTFAEDGAQAVSAAVARPFDVILMDIRMPRMDGLAATRAIRALSGPERATPIIALTANADPDDARRYLAAGMATVVEKPIKAQRLLTALSEALALEPPAQSSVAAA